MKNDEIIARLQYLFNDSLALERWLETPNNGFDDRAPQQLLDAGETEPILRMLDQLESGSYS